MHSNRYDSFVTNVTDDYIWFELYLDRCWASVVIDGPALARRWVGVPCLLGGYPLCAGSVLVHRLRRCPGTAPTLGRSWCLLAFTILCNNVTF